MHIQARRIFRLSIGTALALALAYAMELPLPFIAPLFALLLIATPGPPMGPKSLFGLILAVLISLGTGLLLIPMLLHYPLSAVLLVALGLYFSFYVTVHMGKALIGTFLTVGFTLISAAGLVSFQLATTVIQSLVVGITVAVACHWMVYPWFPEDPAGAKPPAAAKAGVENSTWIALRATLIVLPAYLLALTNPTAYLAIIMKSVSLGQQSSVVDAHSAGRELLGSTFLGGCFAILFWMMLGISTNLWMFFWLMLLFGVYIASKIYRLIASSYPASFWMNVAMTMLILLGPAVEDSDNGKDVYAAFFVRMGLFVAVTLYAWLAVYTLEYLRERHRRRIAPGLEPAA
jgi:uncharacterized membrane protein YgaE (UPF0421/DUF939 family)